MRRDSNRNTIDEHSEWRRRPEEKQNKDETIGKRGYEESSIKRERIIRKERDRAVKV